MKGADQIARLRWDVDPDPELRRAVEFLGIPADAATILRASYAAGVAGAVLTVGLALLAPARVRLPATLAAGTVTALAAFAGRALPRLLATARRARSVGDAPDLVARVVLSMRLSPSPERAAAFAAESGDGALAASLSRHVRRSKRGMGEPLAAFGAEWAPWLPSLERSLALVTAASAMSGADRERTLDDALEVVLEGTREQLRSFGERIQRPVTALYAFGVLLPTALVALLPAGRAAGVGITPTAVIVLYDLLLPAALCLAAGWLIAHRPLAFPPPRVSPAHPDVPDRAGAALLTGGVVALLAWNGAGLWLPSWGPPIGALGLGVGSALLVRYRPVLEVHERVRDVESGLTDALSLVGRRVAGGEAVESAIEHAGEELAGEMGAVLTATARRQRELQMGVREAFLGDEGSLSRLPSPRVRGSVAFLGAAASEGRPAGPALLALASYVEDLRRVEQEARHELRGVCGTLRTTGSVFGPLVAGATVALAEGIDGGAVPGGGEAASWLGLAVGWYVLVLAAVLPALSTGLVNGLDRASVATSVGRGLLAATTSYLGAFLVVASVA